MIGRANIFAAASGALLVSLAGEAHEFKLESTVTAFVKVDEREAHLAVRLPLHVLREIKFPVDRAEIALARADPAIQAALALVGSQIVIFEDGRALAVRSARGRLSLPSDRSFERYEDAVRHAARPPDLSTEIYVDQGYLDAHLVYAIASPGSRFTIRTTLAPELKEYLKVAIRYLPLGGDGRAMVITSRSGTVSLDPSWYEAASGFVVLGVGHILSGLDHLLFLLCLVIPLAGLRRILGVITAFTVAHSFTLLGAAFGLAPGGAWFPPFVETAIAASIVYMALENIVGANLQRRWLLTALFGLVHGFGFSYGLKENLQFAGRHLVVSLLSFNVGIELGQIAVLIAIVPALGVLRRHLAQRERLFAIVLSALVAHTAWHWMLERGEVLWKTDWPALDAEGAVVAARWLAGALLAAGAVEFVRRRLASGAARRGVG
jgi:hypothetical protein